VPDEIFSASLSQAAGATITTPTAVGTIRNRALFPIAVVPGCCNSAMIGLDSSREDS
jgi:hypothetical protein